MSLNFKHEYFDQILAPKTLFFPLRIVSGHLNTWYVATHLHPSPKFKQSRVKTNLHTMSGHQLFRCLSCIRDLASSCSCCWGSAVRVWRCSHVLVLVMGPHHPGIFHSGIPHLVRFWQKHYYSNVDVEIDSKIYILHLWNNHWISFYMRSLADSPSSIDHT